RSGTTSLHFYLDSHPQVFMSRNKEPHFFMLDGIEYNVDRPDQGTLQDLVWTLPEYEALFAEVKDEIAIGESSTGYLPHPNAPRRIHARLPHAKLIAVLRNPVERAFSAFLKYIEYGIEPCNDFGEAVKRELAGNDWRHYVSLGFYGRQLKRYYELFPASQIRVCLYEELDTNPKALLDELFHFLGVDPSFQVDFSSRHNRSQVPVERMGRTAYWRFRVKRGLHKLVRSASTPTELKPALPAEVRRELIQVYREDIVELEKLIQRDLSAWL